MLRHRNHERLFEQNSGNQLIVWPAAGEQPGVQHPVSSMARMFFVSSSFKRRVNKRESGETDFPESNHGAKIGCQGRKYTQAESACFSYGGHESRLAIACHGHPITQLWFGRLRRSPTPPVHTCRGERIDHCTLQLFFQLADLGAQRRLTDISLFGGLAEVADIGQREPGIEELEYSWARPDFNSFKDNQLHRHIQFGNS